MKNFDTFKKEALKDPEMRKEYDALELEYNIISMRLHSGMSQKKLAEKIGTKQSAISRLESAHYNPSLSLLKKVARALGGNLKISIT